MITDADKQTIARWQPESPLQIEVMTTDHPAQEKFTAFAAEWDRITGDADHRIRWQPGDTEADLPGFLLKENIRYSALPLEKELAPFLKGLSGLDTPNLALEIKARLDRIDLPCDLTLYIALQCPHCPGMVDTLLPLAAYSRQINLHIIDGSLFPEIAQKDRVMAAPCLLLDQDFRWTGAVSQDEILSMILNRDPAGFSTQTLKNILEAGDASWITTEMIRAKQIFKGFLGLLLHETWSVRLGAMVVVEELAEQAPDLGRSLVPLLTGVFHEKEIPVQGDILYALGEIGDLETKAWILETISNSDHEDLRDAAEDAVAAIDSRFAP